MNIYRDIEVGHKWYFVEAVVCKYIEDFGHDYDGNRGISRNAVELDDCKVFDENDNDVTDTIYPLIENDIMEWVATYEYEG